MFLKLSWDFHLFEEGLMCSFFELVVGNASRTIILLPAGALCCKNVLVSFQMRVKQKGSQHRASKSSESQTDCFYY